VSLVFEAILPHGPDVIAEIAEDPAVMVKTRAAMEEVGRRFAATRAETVILLSPDCVHTFQGMAIAETSQGIRTQFPHMGEATMTVGTAANAFGGLEVPGGRCISDHFACDVKLAETLLSAAGADFPVVRAAGENGELRLEYGVTIPLWFTVHPHPTPRPELVVVTPSPAMPREALLRFGRLIADVARDSGKRVALIASADQGHTHDCNHKRFGFSPAAAQYDALYCDAVSKNRLNRLLDVSDDMLRKSWSDSLWQTLILAGAIDCVPMKVDLLSYEVPTYYGMVVAVYEPIQSDGKE